MKKQIYTTLVLLFAANLSAQNPNGWIQEGAEWYYGASLFGANSYIESKYIGVETIDGIPFQKISSIEQWSYPQSGGGTSLGEVQNLPDRFFYTSNDSVFLRKEDGALQFVWHLNPQVGDVWDFGVQTDFQGENPMNVYALVTDVASINVAGTTAKNIKTTPCLDPLGTLPNQDNVFYHSHFLAEFNTLFGPTNYPIIGLFLFSQETTSADFANTSLLCYRSETTTLYQSSSSSNCYNNLILTNEALDALVFSLYPNPASTAFTITNAEHILSIQIFDAQGRTQLRSEVLPVDLSKMSSGMYWVQIETVDGQVKTEKLVVE